MNPESYKHATSNVCMQKIFKLCRQDQWKDVLDAIQRTPEVALTRMIMVNHISTTILHQAITSKGDVPSRARVILAILDVAPGAAQLRNGYGSLPLHVISQRNTKMDSSTKEALMYALMKVYPNALIEEGGVGRRTPLHIAFTDYISPALAKAMIERGTRATFMKDRKGWLPVHVACSRHCSPEKLRLLLAANPSSLHDVTHDGHSLLSLAASTATRSHPNFALIDALHDELRQSQQYFYYGHGVYPIQQPQPQQVRTPAWQSRPEDDVVLGQLLLHFHRSSRHDCGREGV